MSLFATKPISAGAATAGEATAAGASPPLRRVLGALDLTLLGIGAIIGTGIFVLTGQAAAAHAGPAVVLSMVVAGIASALATICYAEFAAAVPVAGSAYTYGYATLGELVAWVIGWDLVLEYALGAATVAVGWSGYVVSLLADFGIQFPPLLSAAPGTAVVLQDGSTVMALFNLPAIVISALMLALPRPTWERLMLWMVVGLVIYFAYGRTHSKLRHQAPGPKHEAPGTRHEARGTLDQCHSFFCTIGICSARSRSRSNEPTCSDIGDWTHL